MVTCLVDMYEVPPIPASGPVLAPGFTGIVWDMGHCSSLGRAFSIPVLWIIWLLTCYSSEHRVIIL